MVGIFMGLSDQKLSLSADPSDQFDPMGLQHGIGPKQNIESQIKITPAWQPLLYRTRNDR